MRKQTIEGVSFFVNFGDVKCGSSKENIYQKIAMSFVQYGVSSLSVDCPNLGETSFYFCSEDNSHCNNLREKSEMILILRKHDDGERIGFKFWPIYCEYGDLLKQKTLLPREWQGLLILAQYCDFFFFLLILVIFIQEFPWFICIVAMF